MTSYTAQLSIGYVDEAINYVNSARSKLGAYAVSYTHLDVYKRQDNRQAG